MEELIGKQRVQQWEYHRVNVWMKEGVMEILEHFGKLGWELVSFMPNPANSISHLAYFKRPLP